MNPFRPLRKLLDFVLGDDLRERAPEKKPDIRPPPQRTAASQLDGFDTGWRGPRVDLRGGVKVPVAKPDEPAGPPAAIPPSDFSASLDDLPHVADEPMEPRPEFIPEGGMSTESLMRELGALSADPQAAAVDSFEPASELPPTADVAQVVEEPMPAPLPEGGLSTEAFFAGVASLDADPRASPAQETATTEAARVEPAPAPSSPPPEFSPEGGLSTESLMSEFESLDAETRAAAIAEAAANELARRQAEAAARAEEQVDSFEATSPPVPGSAEKHEAGS